MKIVNVKNEDYTLLFLLDALQVVRIWPISLRGTKVTEIVCIKTLDIQKCIKLHEKLCSMPRYLWLSNKLTWEHFHSLAHINGIRFYGVCSFFPTVWWILFRCRNLLYIVSMSPYSELNSLPKFSNGPNRIFGTATSTEPYGKLSENM